MNDFFNTNTAKTYSISTTKGDYTLTAQDIAKIVAFGERYIHWDGAETWIAPSAVADLLAIFCTEEGAERGELRTLLTEKTDIYTDKEDKAFKSIVNDARDILTEWGSAKLYTCLRKKFEGSDEKFINLDKLETMLGIELTDAVRERLSHVSVTKDSDGDWRFDSATGRSYRETATIGILCEIHDAVQFFPTMLKHVIEYAKQGFTTFEEIAEESFSIDLERWTQGDEDDIKRALAEANITPDRYTVYLTKHNDFGIGISEEVAERWDFVEEVTEFATKQEAADFRSAANKNLSIEKKRQKLSQAIKDAEEHLANLREEQSALLA
jgi:hypothetical protein